VTIAFSPEFYGKSATYILTGMDGKTIARGGFQNIKGLHEISFEKINAGPYFLCIYNENSRICEKIILIEN
jgi:hypothetical protein